MPTKQLGIALVLLLGATTVGGTSAGLAQSSTGGNYGVPVSGTAASRSGGGGHASVRHHDSGSGDKDSSSSGGGERDARSSGGGGSNSSRGERDARDSEGSSPVARQASTPSH